MKEYADFMIPESFLEEEVRCGYLISSKMKKVWMRQLELLSELKRVCDKYNLTYFADSGTLIGAIRHNGYIPWDDDIDIVMKRDDFEKLLRVPDTEFEYPFFLQSTYSDKNYFRGYARLRNSETTAITRTDLLCDINKGIFIDIFPIDNIPDDEKDFSEWKRKITVFSKFIDLGVRPPEKRQTIKSKLAGSVCKPVVKIVGKEKLYSKYVKLCSKYNGCDTERISYIAYSKGKPKHLWLKSDFDGTEIRKFEFSDIAVPIGYDDRLKTEYGNYMEIRHTKTVHGDMILEPDIPYKKYLKEHSEKEILNTLMQEH